MTSSQSHSFPASLASFVRGLAVTATALLSSCDVVLGIDDLNSATADSGQHISPSTAAPPSRDAALQDAALQDAALQDAALQDAALQDAISPDDSGTERAAE